MKIKPHTIGLVCNNLAESLKFYRLLGLDIPDPEEGETHVEFQAENGWVFGFDAEETVAQHDPKWNPAKGSRMGLQFECESTEVLNHTFEKIVSAGYLVYAEPWDAFWGQRFARVLDPDGNIVNFFAEL